MAKGIVHNKVAIIAAISLLAPTALYACIDPDLTECTTDYTNSLEGSAVTDKNPFCRVLRTYYSCVFRVCGTIPTDTMEFFIETQTHYFDCGINKSQSSVSVSSLLFFTSAVLTVSCAVWI